jgi:hypothetical protein
MNARLLSSLAVVAVAASLALLAHADAPTGHYNNANGTVYDTKTKLTWQEPGPSTPYTWTEAKTYCAGLSLDGTGWRLPTVKELLTIVDESRRNPAIDPTAFPGLLDLQSSEFWSSSLRAGDSSVVWSVSFRISGRTQYWPVSTRCNVRCVR